MLEGYKYDKFGIIKKIDPISFDYGSVYQERLLDRGEGNVRMAHLRYGYLVGVIGRAPFEILDVGYGDGAFLQLCASKGHIKCYGSELNDSAIPDGCSFVADITTREYDVICFFDSLEHFADLDFLSRLKCNYVFVSVPNCVYISDIWFQNWFHRKPDQHIFNFSLQSITSLFANYEFELVSTSYIENIIRDSEENILTLIFKKTWTNK